MAIGDIIVGIDIGTSKVSSIIGEVNNFNQIEIICSTQTKNTGIKRGKIIDEDAISSAIREVINEAEEISNLKINSAYITMPGKYVLVIQNSVTKDIKDKYAGITNKDVNSAIVQLKDIEIPEDRVLIDIIPNTFITENGQKTENPIGKICSSFTLTGQVLLAEKEYVKQITSIMKKAKLDIDLMVPTTLAEKNLILDANEVNDNVMILDIGAGNTDIGVFQGSNFIYTNTIPVGGDNITNDISVVLNISEEEADKLKRQYGLALKSFIDNDTDIILNTYKGDTKDSKTQSIKSSQLVEIIEARVEEIFSIINRDITSKGLKQNINNVILTGQGIVNINRSDVAGKIILNIPVKIATGRLISATRPTYRTSFSLVRYIASRSFVKSVSSNIDNEHKENKVKLILERIKDFFYS